MTVAADRKRIRSEECEVLRVASLRSCVQPNEDVVVLGDGTRLCLYRAEVRGVFTSAGTRGTATSLMAHCPSCGRRSRILRKPFGLKRWGCRVCLDLIYPAQRRSGWHKGRVKRKPTTWRLAAICEEQRRIARLLKLQCWPPTQLNWEALDLSPKRNLNQTRVDALLTRLDALENLRVMLCARAVRRVFGIEATTSWDGHTNALESLLLSTKWAMYEHWRQPTTTFKPTDKIKFLRLRHHPTQPHHHH